MIKKIFIPIFFIFLPCITACNDKDKAEFSSVASIRNAYYVKAETYKQLKNFFLSSNYNWDTLKDGVPPVIIETFPEDIRLIPEVGEKKKAFLLSLLPMVLLANNEIERQRNELMVLFRMHDEGDSIPPEKTERIYTLAERYGVKGDPLKNRNARRKLLERVDIVPPSLALAQAANETGWGTSRFTHQANNLFGQWTFTPGTGLVPLERPEGASYEIRRFDNLYESVRSYMFNLNTNRAYGSLRHERAKLREAGLPLRGYDLAKNLQYYSERREDYVRDIQGIIKQNGLSLLSSVTLRKDQPVSPDGGGLLSFKILSPADSATSD